MNKDELETSALGVDEAPILPDGWKDGDDLFADAAVSGSAEADGLDSLLDGAVENEGGNASDPDVPTTDESGIGGEPSAEGEDAVTGSDGTDGAVEKPSRLLKLKVNHQEETFDVNAASDEELTEMAQKARAFDAMKDDQMKAKYRQVYNDQIYAGMTEAAARMVATHECNGKAYPLEDEEPSAETETTGAPVEVGEVKDFKTELRQLQSVFPDVKAMPEEVMTAYLNGASLLTAYTAYRSAQSDQAATSLKRENAVLKQNAAAAAKAPVTGVTGGGKVNHAKKDPFLEGFDSDAW